MLQGLCDSTCDLRLTVVSKAVRPFQCADFYNLTPCDTFHFLLRSSKLESPISHNAQGLR